MFMSLICCSMVTCFFLKHLSARYSAVLHATASLTLVACHESIEFASSGPPRTLTTHLVPDVTRGWMIVSWTRSVFLSPISTLRAYLMHSSFSIGTALLFVWGDCISIAGARALCPSGPPCFAFSKLSNNGSNIS